MPIALSETTLLGPRFVRNQAALDRPSNPKHIQRSAHRSSRGLIACMMSVQEKLPDRHLHVAVGDRAFLWLGFVRAYRASPAERATFELLGPGGGAGCTPSSTSLACC